MAAEPDDPDEAGEATNPSPQSRPDERRPKRPRKQARQWGALAHVSVALALVVPVIGGWAGPLAVRLTKGKTSEFVEENALEALNFGILLSGAQLAVSVIAGAVAGGSALGLGSLTNALSLIPLLITIGALVLPGAAALKANDGKPGRYPDFLPRLVTDSDDDDDEDEDD